MTTAKFVERDSKVTQPRLYYNSINVIQVGRKEGG